MKTNEEIVRKIRERAEYYQNQADECDEARIIWEKKGNFEVSNSWKRRAIRYRKTAEELAKLLEFATED